jgi:hypothetical protein
VRRPFRPVRTVTDPFGYEWELYVSRFVPPAWKGDSDGSWHDDASPRDGPFLLLELPFVVVDFLWLSILRPVLRFALLTPFAVVKGRRTRAVRIEAICWFPSKERRIWTTTLNQSDSIVDEIAAGIAQGRVVQPMGAVYSGSED